MPKKKVAKVDGLGPEDLKKLRSAIRKVWSWSYPRKLCVARATQEDGFSVCEGCHKIVAKVYPDHIIPVGNLDSGFIERMFCPSTGLQALCKKCHGKKTREDNKKLREAA